MDAAEAWLAEHDPGYESSRLAWKDLDGGAYRTPPQEIPWGSAADLALLVDTDQARYVEPVDTIACAHCGEMFAPVTSWQRYCSETCEQRNRERRRQKRERDRAAYMRDYRRRKAA